jgi:hypothetical protein
MLAGAVAMAEETLYSEWLVWTSTTDGISRYTCRASISDPFEDDSHLLAIGTIKTVDTTPDSYMGVNVHVLSSSGFLLQATGDSYNKEDHYVDAWADGILYYRSGLASYYARNDSWVYMNGEEERQMSYNTPLLRHN